MSQEIKICSNASACLIGGLSANDTIYSDTMVKSNCIVKLGGQSCEFLKADGSIDSSSYTTCQGDITSVFAVAGLSGTTFAGDATIGIDSGTLTPFDQSACAGLDCVGTVVAGDIAGFTDCLGDITEVTTCGDYLTGGGLTGAINIGLDAGCAQKWDNASAGSVVSVTATAPLASTNGTSPDISLDSTCASNWDTAYTDSQNTKTCPGLNCEGDITAVFAVNGLSGSTFAGDATIGVDAALVNTLNQSGCPGIDCEGTLVPADIAGFTCCTGTVVASDLTGLDQSGCAGLDCVGDITSVAGVNGLSGAAFGGAAVIGVDATLVNTLNQSGCPGIDCIGTVIASDISGFTCCTGTVVASDLNGLDQSACAGLLCVGDITEVTTNGDYLTGGGLTGAINIGLKAACAIKWDNASAGGVTNVTGSGGISSTGGLTPDISIDSACVTKFDQSACAGLDCVGDITGVFAVNGLSGSTFAGDATIGVDATLVNTLNQSGCPGIDCVGDVVAADISGFTCCTGTVVASDISSFTTCTGTVVASDLNGLDQSGCAGLDCVGDITSVAGVNGLSGSSFAGAAVIGVDATLVNTLNQSSCPGLDCVGDVVAADISGFTCCTGTVVASDLNGLDQSGCAGLDCVGDITSVSGVNGLSGSALAGAAVIGVDATLVNTLNQSSCPGIDCVGTLVATDIAGFTCCTGTVVASDISSFTSCTGTVVASDLNGLDQSACPGLDCVGDITSVAGIAGLSGTALAGAVTLGIDSGTLTPFDQSSCPGLDCVGTVVAGDISSFTTCTGTVVASDLNGLNQSSCPGLDCVGTVVASDLNGLDQSACAGLDCVGDITGVTAGALLSGTQFAGTACIGVNSGALNYLNQSTCPGLDCVGTVVAGDISSFTTCTGTVIASDIANFTCCTGTLVAGDLTACDSKFDQSACAGIDCVGDITSVSGVNGLSGSALAGAAVIGVDADLVNTLNQSACPGIDCIGTVVAGDISGFTTCTGTVVASDLNGLDQSACAGILCTGTLTDAPSDSDYYGRVNGAWACMGGALCEGTMGGSGTNNFIPSFCSTTGLTNSKLRQNFTSVIAGATLSATGGFTTGGQILSAGQELHALLGGGGGGGGSVDSVTAGDTNITIGGTASNPTISVTTSCFTNCNGTVTSINGSDSSMLIASGTTDACVQVATACQTAWNGTYTTVQSNSATWAPPALFNVVDDGATGKLTTNSFADIDTIWDTPAVLDASGYSWNSSTGALTVLKSGNLQITLKIVTWNNLNNRHQLVLRINKNGTFMIGDSQYASRSNTQDEGGAYIPSFIMPVAANDVITFQAKDVGVAATMGGSTQVSKMSYISGVLYPS